MDPIVDPIAVNLFLLLLFGSLIVGAWIALPLLAMAVCVCMSGFRRGILITLICAAFYSIGGPSAYYEIVTGYWAPVWMDPPWGEDCRRNGHGCGGGGGAAPG